jgi:hypothetical protein
MVWPTNPVLQKATSTASWQHTLTSRNGFVISKFVTVPARFTTGHWTGTPRNNDR